jgi:hypothetical protein
LIRAPAQTDACDIEPLDDEVRLELNGASDLYITQVLGSSFSVKISQMQNSTFNTNVIFAAQSPAPDVWKSD